MKKIFVFLVLFLFPFLVDISSKTLLAMIPSPSLCLTKSYINNLLFLRGYSIIYQIFLQAGAHIVENITTNSPFGSFYPIFLLPRKKLFNLFAIYFTLQQIRAPNRARRAIKYNAPNIRNSINIISDVIFHSPKFIDSDIPDITKYSIFIYF